MRYSGIGGQAVMEGVMMKNNDRYAVAVRKPDGSIEVVTHDSEMIIKNKTVRNIPLLRGVINFIESLVLGMSSLMESASYFEEEEEQVKTETDASDGKKKEDKIATFGVVAFSVVIAVLIFMALPYGISLLFEKYISARWIISALEGVIRLVIFVAYIWGISLMDDIKRVYMYHGAEHKCINC
ncbi:MAG: DUF1385 domain-containing protein, partial [Lachnospiraceae bacterium]|nr:DUF1385 domain-containing protein [Lachnospiraceae bacterium]